MGLRPTGPPTRTVQPCGVSMRAGDTEGMGLNPHRKRVVRTGDYFFVATAAVACVALLVWAFFG